MATGSKSRFKSSFRGIGTSSTAAPQPRRPFSRPALALLAALAGLTPATAAQRCESEARDPARGRSIPLALTLPDQGPDGAFEALPLVIWSPGLGGGLAQGRLLAEAWAEAGIATLQLQHPGSDAAVYTEAKAIAAATPDQQQAARLRAARIARGHEPSQLIARLDDVAFMMSTITAREPLGACETMRLDPGRAGIAGHSMGAWVVQIMAGQRLPGIPAPEPLFRAALAVSGSALASPQALPASAAGITGPLMLITSRQDGIPASATGQRLGQAIAGRTALWPALPPGEKHLFVAATGTHNQLAATPRRTPPAVATRLAALTTAWWQATLQDNPEPLQSFTARPDEQLDQK